MKCKYCDRVFKSTNGLSQHTRYHEDKEYAEKRKKQLSDDGKRHIGMQGMSEEQLAAKKLKCSNAAKNRNLGGYKPGSGRGKSGWYKGIWCDSSWELAYVVWHLDNGVNIERNKMRFEYSFNGKKLVYIPDFVVGGELVEIKGYLDDQAAEKIRQCTKPIKLLRMKEMSFYLKYAKEKYGNVLDLYLEDELARS